MNRREFLALIFTSAATEAVAETRWQRQVEHKLDLTKDITWMTHEPLYFTRRRGGDHFVDEAEIYERMYGPENIRQIAATGTRLPPWEPQSASS